MSKFFTLENFQYVYGRIKEIYATQDALGETQSQLDATQTQLDGAKSDLLAVQEGIGSVENELNTFKESVVTQEELEAAISEAGMVSFVVVDELPEIGNTGVIYLLKNEEVEGEATSYTQYIYQNDAFKNIGQAKIDMDNYLAKSEVEFASQEDIDAIMDVNVE